MAAGPTNSRPHRQLIAAVALSLACLVAGCGDSGVICASSTSPSAHLVGCTGDPRDDGLSVAVGQDDS